MPIRRGRPLKWFPQGLSDALDSTTVFPGAMSSLANLIPDPRQINSWVCRPASILTVDFALKGGAFSTAFSSAFDVGITAPGSFISVMKIIGTRAYGMIAGRGSYAGLDIPFSYNIASGAMEIVSGYTTSNLPTSPSVSGAWTPPTIDIVGAKILITHPGFNGTGSNFFGVIDVSTPTSPAWSAANTATNALPAVPTAVKQFNNRAWFAVNPSTGTPGLYFSDVLVPTTITNATNILTFGDNIPITALGALPLNNQLGGIIQSLIVFKGITNMVQVTGDAAASPSTLAQNTLNVATGTLAPNAICSTPKGLAFVAPDGLRIVDFNAQVSDPIGISGSGISVPFTFAVVPSRIAAAYNVGVMRISVQNGYAPGNPQEEYWYDMSRSLWTGPHSFPASLIQPYSNTFITAPQSVSGKLFQSDVVQSSTSTYVENGTQLSYVYKTPLLPNTGQMAENAIVETTIDMALSSAVPVNSVSAIDHDGAVLGSVLIGSSGTATTWGSFNWGSALWSGSSNALRPRRIDWPNPIVADQFYVQLTGNSAQGVGMGKIYLRYEILGYLAA